MENKDFQSSGILLDIVKTEYQNEFSRTSVIDTKVGITLPIIATYFFLLLQFDSIKEIFREEPNVQNVTTILVSVCSPLIYIAAILCAGISLIYLFRSIITQSYRTIDASCFNDKEKMSQPQDVFSAVMITYYIRALEHNHHTNDIRVILYKRGWILAMISLGLFVCYIFLTQ